MLHINHLAVLYNHQSAFQAFMEENRKEKA
jgi:hypothetical protein